MKAYFYRFVKIKKNNDKDRQVKFMFSIEKDKERLKKYLFRRLQQNQSFNSNLTIHLKK